VSKDPNYIDPTDYEYYKQLNPPRHSNYFNRTPQEMARDINIAHDNLRQQMRINDRLVAQIRDLIKQLDRERKWRKLLSAALGLTWAVIWYVIKFAAPLIVKGLAK
jgi:hypothetical protein